MGRKNALASLIGGAEGTGEAAIEEARNIDWIKIRRVQHGLYRPQDPRVDASGELLDQDERRIADARSRRAMRLAHALAFVAGVLVGFAFLRGFTVAPLLLSAAFAFAFAGVVSAAQAASHR